MPLLEGPDCRISVEVLGEGKPVTVFAHGITGSVDELRPLATATAGTRVLFDFRGHGGSESPPLEAGYDHPAMRRDLECVADAFGARAAVALSMGAGALMNLLADRPDRFERLVFFTPATIDGPNEAARALFPDLASALETLPLEEVAARQLDGAQPNPLFEARPYWRALVRERVMRMNATGVPRALRAYPDGEPPVRDASVLRRVEAPALVIAHEDDAIHDAAVARRLASLLPNARLRVWPEPLAQWDDVDALASFIGEFLAS